MLRLIKTNLASAVKPYLRNGSPSFFLNLRELDTLLRERSHLGFEDVAHEIEFVGTILIGRVECGLSRRQGEDQPWPASTDLNLRTSRKNVRSASASLL